MIESAEIDCYNGYSDFKRQELPMTNGVNIKKLESDLWESADLLRSGSKLTSN
ncbi:MAG: hypothetical protein LUD73_04255 [Lachnospiraceae bacterium]|nr:hypothetical protein [Lachnospiraceae bacterium]MCD8249078.1 hypothetical protein [Lachnospiraceae bacterium]